MRAVSPTPTARSAPSWRRSSPSGDGPTPSGSSCHRPSARPSSALSLVSCTVFRRSTGTASRCGHRAFFDDPRSELQLERVLGDVGAEWVTFDTTVLFEGPPASAAEREAWTKKPRLPRRSRALTSYPVVRYIGRD